MSARRYFVGWASLVVATATVSAGTVVVVRQAIGGGDLVNALSQSQVRAEYTAAGRPTPEPLATAHSTPQVPAPARSTTPPAPRTTNAGHPHGSGSATSPGNHESGSGSSTHGGSTPSHSPSSSGAVTRVLSSRGGSVVVRCSSASSSASVYLVSWSPAQGYSVDDVNRGPGQEAEIGFDGDQGSVTAKFFCSSGGPVQQLEYDDGGGGGGGGSAGADGGFGDG